MDSLTWYSCRGKYVHGSLYFFFLCNTEIIILKIQDACLVHRKEKRPFGKLVDSKSFRLINDLFVTMDIVYAASEMSISGHFYRVLHPQKPLQLWCIITFKQKSNCPSLTSSYWKPHILLKGYFHLEHYWHFHKYAINIQQAGVPILRVQSKWLAAVSSHRLNGVMALFR